MERCILGNSDLSVSELCLGTMNFGWKEPQENSKARLDEFVRAGGNFIDTANVYSRREAPGKDFYGKDFGEYTDGTSERLIGDWVRYRGCRKDVVIATKVGFAYPGIEIGTSAVQIKVECEKSLSRLQSDYIDLLYLHMDDRKTPFEESPYAMTELVKEGKVRYIGASNFATWRLAKAEEIAKRYGFETFCCVQQKYSYLRPKHGSDFGRQVIAGDGLFDYAASSGITVLAYSPLLKGYYGDRRKSLPIQYEGPDSAARLRCLDEVAEEVGATPVQIVYSWLMHHRERIIPVVAASASGQLEQAFEATRLSLSDKQIERLNNAGI